MIQILLKVLFSAILLYGVVLVWTNDVNIKELIESPFKRAFHLKSKVDYPNFRAALIGSPQNYREGIDVNGLEWKSDYREVRLNITNIAKSPDVTNFRVDLQLPAGVLKYEIIKEFGFDNLKVSSKTENLNIGNSEEITKIVEAYSNHLHITASKVFSDCQLYLKLYLKMTSDIDYNYVQFDYSVIDGNGNKKKGNFVYPITYRIIDDFVSFSVADKTIRGRYNVIESMIPKTQITFKKDGIVE